MYLPRPGRLGIASPVEGAGLLSVGVSHLPYLLVISAGGWSAADGRSS